MDKIQAIQWLRNEYRSRMGLREARDLAESLDLSFPTVVGKLQAAVVTAPSELWHQQEWGLATRLDLDGRFAQIEDTGTPAWGFRWSVSEADGTLVAEGVDVSWETAKEQAEKHLRLQE